MRIDLATHRAERDGHKLDLTAKEEALLVFFLRHPDEVLGRTRIYEQVWDERYDGTSNTLIGDATSGRSHGHEFAPALRFTVPLFNRNQGGIARAEAELERAVWNRQTVANQILLDVQRAYLQYRQACAELDVLRAKVRPEVEAAIRRAEAAYREGNVTIFVVLETTRQLLDNHLREAQLHGDLRRFWAELERSAGKRLVPPEPPAVPAPPPAVPIPPAEPNPSPSKFGPPLVARPPAPTEPVVRAGHQVPAVPPQPAPAAEEPTWTRARNLP